MNATRISRLKKRREDIARTLAHLAGERDEVEKNKGWMDLGAHQRRHLLLTDLSAWYDGKLRQIDHMIDEMNQADRYGRGP